MQWYFSKKLTNYGMIEVKNFHLLKRLDIINPKKVNGSQRGGDALMITMFVNQFFLRVTPTTLERQMKYF